MPRLVSIRPINLKIVYHRNNTYFVYNLHNDIQRQFRTFERLANYHSPNTKFINGDTSRRIDVQATIRAEQYSSRYRNNIIDTDVMFVMKNSGPIEITTEGYTDLTGQVFTNARIEELEQVDNMTIFYFQRMYHDRIRDIVARNVNGNGSVNFSNVPSSITSCIDNLEQQREERINYNLIYSYHGGPRETNFHKHQEDNDNEKRFFGIELEVDGSRDRNASSEKKNRLATRLNTLLNDNNYNQLVKFEEDSSLGQFGVEIITQPMTMKYIMNNKEKFAEAMRMIEELNYCSHDSQRCGMHIHVSKAALNDNIIDNLYLMFENFRNELVAFSRRTQNGMRWCRFMSDNSYHPERMDEEYIKQHKPISNDHSSAINSGQRNTVEFRIFRGTTKMRTFIANIQLIDNMIDIASKENIEGITWEQIINLKPEYEELIKYNEIRAIISKHQLSKHISKLEITQRPVILVRPFQLSLEGDN